MNLEVSMLSEINQTDKYKYYMWNLKWKTYRSRAEWWLIVVGRRRNEKLYDLL